MAEYHVLNHAYWYDSGSGVTFNPQFSDYDLEVLSGLDNFSGLFPAPGNANYYWAKDRYQELNNANYRPNTTYAYGSCFLTAEYSMALTQSCLVTDKFTYTNLAAARLELFNRHTITSINDITYVPISIWIGQSAAAQRNYYLELHIKPSFSSSGSLGQYASLSVSLRVRIYDYGLQTNTLLDGFLSVAGVNVYDTYQYPMDVFPVFSSWYNGDSETPSVVYQIGFVGKNYNDTWTALPFITGATITNQGHTFRQLNPDVRTGRPAIFTYWESSAYEFLQPDNTVPFSEIVEEMGPFGPESKRDGYPEDSPEGHGDDSSDTIGIPDDPLIGVTNVGFVNVYKTGVASLQDIGVELFPDLQYTNPTPISGSTDVVDSIQNGFNAIITALANIPSIVAQQVAATLINYIIDCHVLPVTPTGGTPENIKVGYKTLNATGDRLSTDYVPFDCGTIKLGEYYGSFADFMTGAKLFLPFVGFVPARPEWFYADTLGVKYKFNVIDGSFVAYVTSTGKYVNNGGSSGTVIAQYSGNACVHLPITGVTYASMVSGLVGAGAGAVASAGSGNIPGVASSVTNAASVSGDIPQSNAYASSGAFLSVRRPYLMIERPVTNYSPTFRKERGLPSNISRKLQNMSGFTILQDVHLDGITATDAEKKELEALLSKGVIF